MEKTNEIVNLEKILDKLEYNMPGKRLFGRNNKAWLSGTLKTDFEYSHTAFSTKYYKSMLVIKRNSGIEDQVVIVLPENLLGQYVNINCKGKFAEVFGEIRIYKRKNDDTGTSHLELYVFARHVKISDVKEELYIQEANIIYIEGTVFRTPICRGTPMGRTITDIVIRVERNPQNDKINKFDNIPCIAWGRIAKYAKDYEIGTHVKLYGRLQSREYLKRISPDSDEGEIRTTYEVSVFNLFKTMPIK